MLTKANMAVVFSLGLLAVTTMAFSVQFKPHPAAATSVAGAGHHIARSASGGTDPLDPASRVVTKVVYDYPPGVPAIRPTLSVTTQSVAAYTQSAVEQYFATHQLFTPMSSTVGTVTKALFIAGHLPTPETDHQGLAQSRRALRRGPERHHHGGPPGRNNQSPVV